MAKKEKGGNHEIGYCRPPSNTRFQKGRSGNPKGRPRGSKNELTLLRDELNQSIVVLENGKQNTITKLHAIQKQLVNKSLKGDHKFISFILTDRLPKIQAAEERAEAAKANEYRPPEMANLFTSALEFATKSGAIPPKYAWTLIPKDLREAILEQAKKEAIIQVASTTLPTTQVIANDPPTKLVEPEDEASTIKILNNPPKKVLSPEDDPPF